MNSASPASWRSSRTKGRVPYKLPDCTDRPPGDPSGWNVFFSWLETVVAGGDDGGADVPRFHGDVGRPDHRAGTRNHCCHTAETLSAVHCDVGLSVLVPRVQTVVAVAVAVSVATVAVAVAADVAVSGATVAAAAADVAASVPPLGGDAFLKECHVGRLDPNLQTAAWAAGFSTKVPWENWCHYEGRYSTGTFLLFHNYYYYCHCRRRRRRHRCYCH